jgi:hypothetical protein
LLTLFASSLTQSFDAITRVNKPDVDWDRVMRGVLAEEEAIARVEAGRGSLAPLHR